MPYTLIPWILEQEGPAFQQVEHRWQPKDLLLLQQARVLLQDMARRHEHLSAAEDELQGLERADTYIKLLRRMRLWLRQANFTWRSNQLSFLQAVSGFYSDYGYVLRFLKLDEARGKFRIPSTL